MKQFLEQRGLVGEKEVSAYAPTELFFCVGLFYIRFSIASKNVPINFIFAACQI